MVYVQYSNHPELKTEPSQHSSGVSILIVITRDSFGYLALYLSVICFALHFLPQTSKIIAAGGDYPYSADGQGALAAAAAKVVTGNKSNVIRAVIDKLWYPITVEVLYKVR